MAESVEGIASTCQTKPGQHQVKMFSDLSVSQWYSIRIRLDLEQRQVRNFKGQSKNI